MLDVEPCARNRLSGQAVLLDDFQARAGGVGQCYGCALSCLQVDRVPGGVQNVPIRRLDFGDVDGSLSQAVQFGDLDLTILVGGVGANQLAACLFDAELRSRQQLHGIDISLFNDEGGVLEVLHFNRMDPTLLKNDFLPIPGIFVAGRGLDFFHDVCPSKFQVFQMCYAVLTGLDIPVLICDGIGDAEHSAFQLHSGIVSVHLDNINSRLFLVNESDGVFLVVIRG